MLKCCYDLNRIENASFFLKTSTKRSFTSCSGPDYFLFNKGSRTVPKSWFMTVVCHSGFGKSYNVKWQRIDGLIVSVIDRLQEIRRYLVESVLIIWEHSCSTRTDDLLIR